tara:strand:+ start:32511 stop:32849 length:339 start_codon:yes stop_codon:yes gene_type:complete
MLRSQGDEVNKNQREQLYKDASNFWGETAQKVAAIEELSELMNEVAKNINGKNKRGTEGMIDELADCRIMIEQLEQMFQVESHVEIRINQKLEKLRKIINGKIDHIHKGINQ